jgi:hypothetical protein
VSKYHFKNFPGASPRTPIQKAGEGREGGKGKQGRGGKERGWDGRVRELGSILQIKFYDFSTAGAVC